MKRFYCSIFIIFAIAAVCVGSSLKITSTLSEMDEILVSAIDCVETADYDGAISAMDRFDALFQKNEKFFIIFIKRELIYNLLTDSGTLRSYANDESKHDFWAESTKARRHIVILRDSLLGPI